jgi:hypothetical protein
MGYISDGQTCQYLTRDLRRSQSKISPSYFLEERRAGLFNSRLATQTCPAPGDRQNGPGCKLQSRRQGANQHPTEACLMDKLPLSRSTCLRPENFFPVFKPALLPLPPVPDTR